MVENEFEEQGVQFKVITEDMYDATIDFINEHFTPDEPLSR